MTTAKLFKHGGSQAVRLPKAFRFPGNEVLVEKRGEEVVLRSKRGERVLKAKDFQLDMLTTAREADEMIVAVRFPVHAGYGVAFNEVARRHGDFAMVAIAAFVEDKNTVRLGIGGIAATPVVQRITMSGIKDAVEELASGLEGYEDLHASADLRRDILRNLAPIVIAEAQKCAA